MASQLAASIAALGIAFAPALLKFADAPRSMDVETDVDATVACVSEADAPVHARYQSTGTSDRLKEHAVVQIISKRKEWRHIAYVADGTAMLGWITTDYLAECDAGSPTKKSKSDTGRSGRAEPTPTDGEIEKSPHVMFGVPIDKTPSDDFLIDHGIYVVSYNAKKKNPNWVSWKLSASDLGDEDRANDFRADEDLPQDFARLTKADYDNTGYDRGHMCPSAHRTSSAEANSLTFLMTNMQPQLHALNGGPWKSLETYERNLVDAHGKEVYVIAGGIFGRAPETVGPDIAVPTKNFRITIVLNAKQGIKDVDVNTPVYAVEMPNSQSSRGHKWFEFKVKASQVEKDTGYDFLSALPDELEKQIEATLPPDP